MDDELEDKILYQVCEESFDNYFCFRSYQLQIRYFPVTNFKSFVPIKNWIEILELFFPANIKKVEIGINSV